MHKKTWGLVAQTSAAKIYWLFAMLVTTTITARFLGPDGRGIYVAATSWAAAFFTMGYLSLSQVVVFLATGKPQEEWLPRMLGSLLAIVAVISVAGWAVALAAYAFSGGRFFHHLSPAVLIVALAALPLMLWVEYGNGILMAIGKLHVLNVGQVAGATANLLLTVLFIGLLKWQVVGGLGAVAIAQLLIFVITFTFITREAGALRFDLSAVKDLLKGGTKLHMNAIGTYLFSQANILILNNYRSPSETAYYQLAVQLMNAMQIIPMAVSTVAYSLVAKEGPDAAWPQHRKLLGEVVLLVTFLAVIGYFVAPFIVPLIFGKPFATSVPLFRILLFAVVGMTMSTVMACQWISRGLFLHAALLTILVGGITVLANFLVVPRYGMVGAAWVTVGTYSISIVGNGIMALWVQSRWRRYTERLDYA